MKVSDELNDGEGFDELLCENFSIERDLNKEKLKDFLLKAGMPLDLIAEEALWQLGLIKEFNKEMHVNNAYILFFALEPQKFVEQSCITCVRYQGNSMASVIDRKALQGDLLALVDEAESFVKRHTRLAYRFNGFKRIDVEEYPFNAVREAIINAVCHRKYFLKNNVFVNVFDDRIEVISPGSIPNNLSLKEVYGTSNPRNFKVVELFKKVHYIERLGSGLKRMDELMLLHGLKKPLYEANKAFFKATFFGPKEKILGLVKSSNETDLRELGLNERQIKALNYLQKQAFTTRSDYQKQFKVSKMTAFRDLLFLIEKGMIKSEGKSVSAKYFLSK
ncbi:MAG: ATP-binding protein [Candidatus Diapherotrites archaeon]